jgi:hypothetical protein
LKKAAHFEPDMAKKQSDSKSSFALFAPLGAGARVKQ